MPARPQTVVHALARALAADPGRPLVTFYDGSSGERVELSVKTFDNWVNKVANLFVDELMLDPGDGVRVRLPTHWQSTVLLLGVWTAGLRLVADDAPGSQAAASVVGPTAAAHAGAYDGQVVVCSLRPLGGPCTEPIPAGWLDFAVTVPGQPDALLTPVTVRPDDIAVVGPAAALSHGGLVHAGLETAAELRLSEGGRLLTDANPSEPGGTRTALVAPLVSGSSVVLVSNGDETTRRSIAEQERVTATAWLRD
jgi:uncharacterized protein (TIGR03089 family)